LGEYIFFCKKLPLFTKSTLEIVFQLLAAAFLLLTSVDNIN
jgi:hypothetical protein